LDHAGGKLLEELLGLATTVAHAGVDAVHAEVAVNGTFDHVATGVATSALAVIGALFTRSASAAATTTTVVAALFPVALRRAALYTLEGIGVTLLTPGTGTATTAATVIATLLGESEDCALRLTATTDAFLVELTALPAKGKFEAERLGIPPIAGFINAVD
jgi:hypothetical protein